MSLMNSGVLLSTALLLAGCGGGLGGITATRPATNRSGALPTYSYPLSAGDKLRVAVFEVPQLSGDFLARVDLQALARSGYGDPARLLGSYSSYYGD